MKSEEIIVVINEICSKIGATSTEFIPKLVAYGKFTSGFGLFCCILIIAILGYIAWKFSKVGDTEIAFLASLLAIIPGFTLLICLHEFITWSIMPDAKSVIYILSKMGG